MPRRQLFPLLLLIAFWAALYLPRLLAGQTLPARDVSATQIPWRTVWRQQILAREPPLWDPYSNGGRPLLANPNAMAAYPGTLLFLALTPETAAGLHLALHHLLLLLGCYRLARRTGAAPPAAAVGATAAGTCGIAWSSLTFLNFQASLVWVVWALATAVPPPPGGRAALRRALAGGALIGLAFLGGEPVTALFGAGAWCLIALWTWRPRPWLSIGPFAGAAFLLAAPVLVPLLVIFPETVRGALQPAQGALSADALAPRRFLELIFPNLLGPPLGDGTSGFWARSSFPWQRYYPLIFLGAMPVLCLPFARRTGRALAPWWVIAAAGGVGAIVLAPASVAERAQGLPFLGSIRYAVKFLLLVLPALSPLVAAGWERLTTSWNSNGRRWVRCVALAALLLAPMAAAPGRLLPPLLGTLYPASRASLATFPEKALTRAVRMDWLALLLPPAVLAVAGPAPLLAVAATLGANVLGGSGVLLFDDDNRWAAPPPARTALPDPPVLAVLELPDPKPRFDAGLERFWVLHRQLAPQSGTRWGVEYILARGPDGLEPVYEELLAGATSHMSVEERARVASALGATAVISRSELSGWDGALVDGVWVGRVAHPSGAAYLARRLLPADSMLTAATLMASEGFHPGEDAAVPGGGGAREAGGGSVEEISGTPHHRRFDLTAHGSGLLVVQQSFMSCWRARVDGTAVRTELVNGAATGIRVPAGHHRVELSVDPAPYLAGAAGPVLLLLIAGLTRKGGPSTGRGAASGAAGRSTRATPPEPRP